MNLFKIRMIMASIFFLIVIGGVNVTAGDLDSDAEQPMSIMTLKDRLVAPRIYSIKAYVIEKYDQCPPCPPKAVCETCQLGIFIADRNLKLESGIDRPDGLYLPTRDAASFRVGALYIFTISYRVERNRAGAWLRSGPQLVQSSPAKD